MSKYTTTSKEQAFSQKVALITGVANNMSIAWHVAQLLKAEGVEIILSYPAENLRGRVCDLAEQISAEVLYMNVVEEASISSLFEHIAQKYGKLDYLLHSIAFSDKDELKGMFAV